MEDTFEVLILPPLPGNEAACNPTAKLIDAEGNDLPMNGDGTKQELTIEKAMLGDLEVKLE